MACADAEALLKVCRHRHPALIPGLKFEPRSSSEGLGLPSYSVLQYRSINGASSNPPIEIQQLTLQLQRE